MESFLFLEELTAALMYLAAAAIFGYLLYRSISNDPPDNESENDKLVRTWSVPAFACVLALAIIGLIASSFFKWTAIITLPGAIGLFIYILYRQYFDRPDETPPETRLLRSGLSLSFGILLGFSVLGLIILPPVGWAQVLIALPSMNMILILFGAVSFLLLTSVFYYVEILNRSLTDVTPPNRTVALRMRSQQNIARIGGFTTWAAMVAVTITVVAGQFTLHTKGVVLVVLCAALAHNLLMLFMPWNKINSSIVFRLWGSLSMLLIALGVWVTGGFDSRFSMLFILLLVLGGSYLRFKESLIMSISVSVVYTLESIWLLPSDRLGEAIPVIIFEVAVFILTTLGSAYIMNEVRKQIEMNKAFKQEAAEIEVKETPINSLIDIKESMDIMDVNALLDNSLIAIAKFLNSETGYIMLWDEENQALRLKCHTGHSPVRKTETLRLGQGITGEAALRKQIVSFSSQTGKYFAHPMYGNELFQSGIAVPLVYYGRLLGCLTVYCSEDRLFAPDEQSLLFLIAERLALTLENARLYAETERSGTESQLLSDTVRDIGTLGTSKEVLEYATIRISQMTGMEKCITAVVDDKANLLRVAAVYGETSENIENYTLNLEGSLGNSAIKKGKAIAVENAYKLTRSHLETATEFNVKSFVIVPIMSGKSVYGLFYIFNSEDYKKLDQKTMNLVEAFSKMVGIFIDNLRLVENLNSQIARLIDLGEVSTMINAKLNLQETLDIIVSSAARILNKRGVVLALMDDEGYLMARSTSGVSEQFKRRFRLSPKDGLAREIFQDGKTHYTSDYLAVTNPSPTVVDENLNMIIGVPLKDNRGKIFGILYTGETEPYAPDTDEISFITLFASQASMAVSNALLYDDQDKKLRVFENLYQISSNLSRSQASMAPTFIVEKTAGLLEAEYCGYLRYDENEALLSLVLPGYNIDPAQWGIRGQMQLSVKEGLGYQIFYSWEPRIITPPLDRPVQGFDQFPYGKLRELICVRLGTPSKTVGVLFAANKKTGSFNQEDRRLMALVAHQVNVFMDNAQLLADVKTQVQNLTDLMDVANAVQGSLRMEEILDTIVAKAWTRFKAHTCQINLLNPQKGFVEIAAYRGFTPRNLQRSDDKEVKLYTSRCPAIVNNNSFIFSWENRKEACPYFSTVNPARSYMCAPLRIGDQTQGVLHITSLKENAFTQDDLNLLASFATEASLAVQRAQLFAAIADENAKIETIIQSIDDPMAVFGPDSKVTMVNEAFYRYFSVSQKDVIGSILDEITESSPFHIDTGDEDLRTILSITLKKAFRGTTTCNIASPDRHYFTRVTFTPIIDVQLNITGAVALFHDITEMQNLLEQLELEKEKAEEANRLKSEFLANMSHELRTPLNSIIGYTHCVLDELDGPVNDEQTKDLNRVVSSAENLLHLINDILDLSKIESGKMELFLEKTEASSVIREVIIAVNPVAEQKKLVLSEKIEPDLPFLYADSFRIRQVLMNLISNSIKFTSEGGVTAGAYYEPTENAVVFYVRDTGIGISEESVQYIFEEFRQADGSTTRRFGGSGLGLSISRRLVEMLGGSIWVESKVGEGSCFFFTVPVLEIPQSPELAAEPKPISEKENSRIVVIDDDNEDIKVISQFLEPEGYIVISANSGQEGLKLIKEHKPMAILLDVLMPDFDGWQTLYDIKADQELQNIPVIMASVIENRELGFALGAAEYLAKPVRKPDLLRKISIFRSIMVNETILVVDDDPDFCELVEKMLGPEFRVLTANSGEEALELLNVYMPDLVLVDLMMPGMDGFQFIFHVRSNYSRSLPLIVISAKDITDQERNYLHELFVDNIIRKGALQKEEFVKYLGETLTFFETLQNKGEVK